jgi:hypothetical protein
MLCNLYKETTIKFVRSSRRGCEFEKKSNKATFVKTSQKANFYFS